MLSIFPCSFPSFTSYFFLASSKLYIHFILFWLLLLTHFIYFFLSAFLSLLFYIHIYIFTLLCLFLIFKIYFWLRWVFVAVRRLSLVVASGGYSSLWCAGFSLLWPLLLWSTGSRHAGFSSCGTWAQQLWLASSRAQAQQLWRMGSAARRHVGSSRTRTRTRVPCIGRRILNHCSTREALPQSLIQQLCICFLKLLFDSFKNHFGQPINAFFVFKSRKANDLIAYWWKLIFAIRVPWRL